MKRITSLLLLFIAIAVIAVGCSSNNKEETAALDKKHPPLPDYVLNSSEKVKETYMIASNYPEVVASVPCYCGCYESAGHESNLNCFITDLGPNNEVIEWDPHGIA